jgi:hypothetical protein
MGERQLPIEEILAVLDESPRRIAELTDGLGMAQLHVPPGGGEFWSANDALAHLRSCADVWGGAARTMLAEDRPTIRAVNPVTWIKSTDYRDLEFHYSLRLFTAQRAELLAVLAPLRPQDWLRPATVTGAGAVLERTVRLYAQWLARHERSHWKQFGQIAAAMRAMEAEEGMVKRTARRGKTAS